MYKILILSMAFGLNAFGINNINKTEVDTNIVFAGGDSSGGGDPYVAHFTEKALSILSRVEFESKDYKLLTDTLSQSKIKSVRTLTNPTTGLPVPNQENILAYSSPALIQLKVPNINASSTESWDRVVKEDRPVAHIIIHELYRASGKVNNHGNSIDDNFQLSIGKYELNKYDSDGLLLNEPVKLHYWSCHCFQSLNSGSADGGMNIVEVNTLGEAQAKAVLMCKEFDESIKIAQCHKLVGNPY